MNLTPLQLKNGTFLQIMLYLPMNLTGISSLSRKDLLATKFYAGYPRDREDIQVMKPTREELDFVRCYLNMLRVPARNANLDQVQRALLYLDAMEADK